MLRRVEEIIRRIAAENAKPDWTLLAIPSSFPQLS